MKFHQIIFDFDGVILNSHLIKNKAFFKISKNHGKKIAQKALEYHKKHSGVSRFIKFNFIIKNFLNENVNKKKIDFYSHKFNRATINRIYNLKIPQPLINFLKKEYKNINLYISTGTPQKVIEKILKKKKIFKYFKKVYGSPKNKINHITSIKKNKKKTVFIGDSLEDYNSCKKTNTLFILKEHRENKGIFTDKKVIKIKNFKNFKKFLLKI